MPAFWHGSPVAEEPVVRKDAQRPFKGSARHFAPAEAAVVIKRDGNWTAVKVSQLTPEERAAAGLDPVPFTPRPQREQSAARPAGDVQQLPRRKAS